MIEGFGLKGASSTSVAIDGVSCAVDAKRSTDEKIFCETGPKATASVTGPQPGQPGITYTFVNPTDETVTPNWANSLDNTFQKTSVLSTSLETLWNSQPSTAAHVFDGWFKAPENGRYRFYMQADDQYRLYLDSANPYDPVTPVTTSLVEIG